MATLTITNTRPAASKRRYRVNVRQYAAGTVKEFSRSDGLPTRFANHYAESGYSTTP